MFANNHHKDGYIAVWIPAPPGLQAALVKSSPKTYFRPPYVGPAGWVGIDLNGIGDDDLAAHIIEAFQMIISKRRKKPGSARRRL